MECQIKKNLQNCPCTYKDCALKGQCCECIAFHRKERELPACYFTAIEEKSYDRSIDNFLSKYRP
jgi:Domain of unknown function (DUF6485)